MKKTIIWITTLLLTTCVVVPAQAEPPKARFSLPYLGGNVGSSKVQEDGFSSSESLNAFAGYYLLDNLSTEFWLAHLGQFDLNDFDDTYSESYGIGATAAYRIDLARIFALRPSIGLFYARTKIIFEGREVGEDTNADWMAGLSGVFTIKSRILININTHWFNNISGGEILMISTGAGYQF